MSSRSRSGLLSVARRLFPKESGERITQQLERLASLSNEEYALHKTSCSACHLHESSEYHGRQILVHSLSEDCHFCEILRKCYQHFANDCDYMQAYIRGSRNDVQICFRATPSDFSCREIHVQLYSKESLTHQSLFQCAKGVCESAGSEASIGVMKEWISRCHMTHQHAPPIHGCKPTRLIKLAKDDAQLYSPEIPVKFAALSYLWGPGKQSETTKENVFERYKELKTSDFPKTLQDAIHVTRRLGLEYIWIDRICIVQDDKEEWTNEASLMADIYASAYVVLSATATEDCKDGFLQKRVEPLVIQYTQRGQENCEVRARQIESHWCTREAQKTNYTLFQRGWCMQERFLARRTIHFLPDEILFECQAGPECECGAASKETMLRSDRQGFHHFASLRAAPSMEGLNFAWEWFQMLWDYSKMKLTYGEDSLPALSGLATCMEHLKPGKYIAGLWQHGIALQLGWCLDSRSSIRRWKYPKNVDILGLTFSWSSHVHPMQSRAPYDTRSICSLIKLEVDRATPNPYGQVRHVCLCLRGRVVPGDDMVSGLKTSKLGKYTGCVYLDSGYQFNDPWIKPNPPDDAQYEELKNEITWKSVICFGLYEYAGIRDSYLVDALLLQPDKTGAGEYVRIGVVQKLEKSWFDEFAVLSTITIV